MAGIGVVANPHSKLNRRNPDRSRYLSYIVARRGYVAVTGSVAELSDVARSFKEQEIDTLAISGGDGTISQTLTAFHRVYGSDPFPQVALLRGGNMNVLASNLGIKGTPEQILYRLIEQHSTQKPIEISQKTSLLVEGQIGFLFAHGTPARFLEKFYQNKKGSLGAAWLISKIVLSRFISPTFYRTIVTHTPTTMQVDDQPAAQKHTIAVLISSLAHMPMGPRLFPAMSAAPPSRAQLIAYSTDPLKASTQVPWDAFLRPSKPSPIKTSLVGEHFRLHFDSLIPYTLDGELYHPPSHELAFSCGPVFSFLNL